MTDDAHGALLDDLSVVIPAYNEEHGIVATLESLRNRLPGAEIIVVDDGSVDGTAARAQEFGGVTVVQHRFNLGYGGALKTGMRNSSRPVVAWFDADNEHKVDTLLEMVRRLHDEKLAAVLGQRSVSVNRVRGVGKFLIRMLAWLLNIRTGSDLNCGLRVFRRDVIEPHLDLLPNGYSASLTSTIMLVERRFPFAFHPLEINARIGNSKVALSDGFETMLLVLRLITLFAPMRIFLRLSILLTTVGMIYGTWVALERGQGIPVLAALLVIMGVIVGVLGLIADQVSQMRIQKLEEPGALVK